MSELQYEIALETPLGPRKGRLLLTVAENTCTGILEVMRERNPVTGTISKDGQCHLTGNIRTLLHSRAFTADGKCLPEAFLPEIGP